MGRQFTSEESRLGALKGNLAQHRTVCCLICQKEFGALQGLRGHLFRSHSSKGLALASKNAKKGIAKRQILVREGKDTFSHPHSVSTKARLSVAAKRNNLGGQFCGKKFTYVHPSGKEIWLHSRYEETVAKSLDQHGILWERPGALWYTNASGKHRYYPDFYLPTFDVYLDPKNDYLIRTQSEKVHLAAQQNNKTILILSSNRLEWSLFKDLVVGAGVDPAWHS